MELGKLVQIGGRVTAVSRSTWTIAGLSHSANIGDLVSVTLQGQTQSILAEVTRVDRDTVTAIPYSAEPSPPVGVVAWHKLRDTGIADRNGHGRVIDARGNPIDGLGPLPPESRPLLAGKLMRSPLQRDRVGGPIVTGVRAIDVFTPLIAGQRIGVFAGSGVGKSTLLAMLAQAPGFDSAVIALVGERGREVREFVEDVLGPALPRAIVVASTSDESAMMRRDAPRTAMIIADALRARGERVLLIIDSLTRYAHALREIAIASGELPISRGYPPSVFNALSGLIERAGPGAIGSGSITAICSVLIDGDDHNDPVADAVRGFVDGHLVLDRAIGDQGRFPAIDLLRSISRLATRAWTAEQRALVSHARKLTHLFEESRDLRQIGGYTPGRDATLDRALIVVPRMYTWLNQSPGEPPLADLWGDLQRLMEAP